MYLSTFYNDLNNIVNYISGELCNPEAAASLLDTIEKRVNERMKCPQAFETSTFDKKRKFPYRKIVVKNYIIYYVIYDDIVEFRRILYKRRDTKKLKWE